MNMSNIQENLKKIREAVYGKEVRQAIHDSIHDCYEDGKSGATDLIAREMCDDLKLIKADNTALEDEKNQRITAITQERSERQKEIDVERKRINNLAKLQEGGTTGDAELKDIRVGADGKTYENAGEAVRGQVIGLKEYLDIGVNEEINFRKNLLDSSYANQFPYLIINAKQGERYLYKAKTYALEAERMYTFELDSVIGNLDPIVGQIRFLNSENDEISNVYIYANTLKTLTFIPQNTESVEVRFYASFATYFEDDAAVIFSGFKIYSGIKIEKLSEQVCVEKTNKILNLDVESDFVDGNINNGKDEEWNNVENTPRLRTDVFYNPEKIKILNNKVSADLYVVYYREPDENTYIKYEWIKRSEDVKVFKNEENYFVRFLITTSAYAGNKNALYSGIYVQLINNREYEIDIFKNEIEKTVKSVMGKISGKCLVMPWLTDTHDSPLNADAHETAESTLQNLKRLCGILPIDGILHTGDFVEQKYYEYAGLSNESVYECISKYINRLADCGKPVYPIVGNHDGKLANNSDADIWYNNCNGKILTKYNKVVLGSNLNYYYVDYQEARTRLVCLAIPDDNYWGPGGEQLNWLVNTALDTPDGFGVIVAYHMPQVQESGIYNAAALSSCLTAYHEHKKGSAELHSGGILEFDFTKYRDTKAICTLVGHEHGDFVLDPGKVSENGQRNDMPCPIIGLAASGWITSSGTGIPEANMPLRERNTVSENLFDIIVYSQTNSTLDIIRFGAGEDRTVILR